MAGLLSQLAPLAPLEHRPAPRPAQNARAPEAQARQAAEEFEAVYLSLMFQSMFTDIGNGGPFSAGPGEKIYRSHLYEELGRTFARSGGVGIADAVYREMMRYQEVQQHD